MIGLNIMSFDTLTLQAVKALFDRAEDAIKRYERITLSVLTPAINQLRYAGHHLLEASLATNEDEADALLTKVRQHCERAYYDALECSVSELLGFFARFYQAGYSEQLLCSYLPDFPEWKLNLQTYQRQLLSVRRLKTLSEEEINALEVALSWLLEKHFVLRNVITCLLDAKAAEEKELAELERQAKQIQAETEIRRENRRYWHAMVVAYASAIVGLASLVIAILTLL